MYILLWQKECVTHLLKAQEYDLTGRLMHKIDLCFSHLGTLKCKQIVFLFFISKDKWAEKFVDSDLWDKKTSYALSRTCTCTSNFVL